MSNETHIVDSSWMSSPLSPRYKEVYQHIADLAGSHGYESLVAAYPGHGRGVLTFKGAVESAKRQCVKSKPVWIIARSFGCDVAAEILSDNAVTKGVEGAVLWGPAPALGQALVSNSRCET